MSEMNEKLVGEFLDLLKKVNSLEIQVHGIAKDHTEITTKCTKMMQGMQDSITEGLNKQNELVRKTNDHLAVQVNNALGSVKDVAKSTAQTYIAHNKPNEDRINQVTIEIRHLHSEMERLSKAFNSIIKAFKAADNVANYKSPEIPTRSRLIEDVGFTARTQNCLLAENIHTLDDLVTWSASKLLKTPNLGRKSLREIQEVLDGLELELSDD